MGQIGGPPLGLPSQLGNNPNANSFFMPSVNPYAQQGMAQPGMAPAGMGGLPGFQPQPAKQSTFQQHPLVPQMQMQHQPVPYPQLAHPGAPQMALHQRDASMGGGATGGDGGGGGGGGGGVGGGGAGGKCGSSLFTAEQQASLGIIPRSDSSGDVSSADSTPFSPTHGRLFTSQHMAQLQSGPQSPRRFRTPLPPPPPAACRHQHVVGIHM